MTFFTQVVKTSVTSTDNRPFHAFLTSGPLDHKVENILLATNEEIIVLALVIPSLMYICMIQTTVMVNCAILQTSSSSTPCDKLSNLNYLKSLSGNKLILKNETSLCPHVRLVDRTSYQLGRKV